MTNSNDRKNCVKIKGYKLPFYILNIDDVNYLLKEGIDKYTIPIWDRALVIITSENGNRISLTQLWNQFGIYIGNTISSNGVKKDYITPFKNVSKNHNIEIDEVKEYYCYFHK